MKKIQKTSTKILSMILVLLITMGMVPTTALASNGDVSYTWETDNNVTIAQSPMAGSGEERADSVTITEAKPVEIPLGLSGETNPEHWMQEYQKWALEQSKIPSRIRLGSPSFDMLNWGSGQVTFGNTAYIGSPLPEISFNGQVAFCAEFNNQLPTGNYTSKTEGSDSTIKQYLANYDASEKGEKEYIAMQMLVWAKVMGTSVTSWGGTGASATANTLANGSADSSNIKYWIVSGGKQNIIIYTNEKQTDPDEPDDPDDPETPTNSSSTLTIYKRDARTNQVLAGAVFEVRNIGGGSYGTYTTNSSGVATLDIEVPKIGLGLVVTEISPPPGYYLSENNVQDLYISYGQVSASVTFVNDPAEQGELVIYKLDAKTGQVLAGGVFEVRNASGGVLGTITTDSSGKGVLPIHDVPREGITLVVEEKSPPPNYYLSDDNVKDVHIPYGTTSASVTFVNDPVVDGEIVIYKRDAKTNALLAGCVLEIREINGGVLGVVTTDANGKGALPVDIPREGLGLVITELSPPPNYYLSDDNVKDVFIPYGHTSAEVTFVNDPILKSELRILKISEAGTPVPNTEFEVRMEDSATSTTVTTGADGTAVLTETPPTWYTVTEKSVPEPYILDTTPQVIELLEGETHRLTFTNKSKSEVVILKTDVQNKPLTGAIFEVKYKDSGTLIGEFTSDSAGRIVLTGVLPDSWITITEKSAPDGYVISTQTKEIQVASDSKTEVHFVNNQKPKLQLKKVDEQDNSTVLKDGIFKISYKNGGTIGTFSTNEQGIIFLEDLEPNQWVLIEEIQAPQFYLENDEIFEVFLEVDKTAEIIITNKRKPTIQLEKRDSISKQPLQFSVFLFERLDENTNSWVEVGTYTTDENGRIVVESLEHVGRYRYYPTNEKAQPPFCWHPLTRGCGNELIVRFSRRRN